MQLSIIIVNYNAKRLITDCINSALQFASGEEFEWIIVDNNSVDDSKTFLTTAFPFIKWIDMGYNSGFARANNAGILQSKSEIVLLLNPDIIIVDDCIRKCLENFINDSAIACSVQLINPDGSPQITGNYFMRGGLNHLLPLPYFGRFLRNVAFFLKSHKTNVLRANEYETVDWINGAFLMVKKSVIARAGLMDKDFFLYAEEVEWCARLKKYGQLVVYGNLIAVHLQGEIINAETNTAGKGYFDLYSKKGLQLIISNNLRIRKQYGLSWFFLNVSIYILEIPIFCICSFINNMIYLKNPFKEWKKILNYSKNVSILIFLSPKIIFKRNYLYKMM
ncbi:MAG TPA: glycosyltransferase family 2 protein [Parafilimonas sp.]|nr:glycosyltransferase family 2 protein [Parafilimonas sp.]